MENSLKCIGLEIEVEFALVYEGQPLFGDLPKYFNIGFEFIDFTSIHRWERKELNNYGQCIFSDGFDVRQNILQKIYLKILRIYFYLFLIWKI